jgi:hypothetical protein
MIWGAVWISGRSELFIMERDETSKRGGYSARSYLQVLEDQLPIIWSPGNVEGNDDEAFARRARRELSYEY